MILLRTVEQVNKISYTRTQQVYIYIKPMGATTGGGQGGILYTSLESHIDSKI